MSDDDPEALRERVEQLEQAVRSQQATIQKLLPGRRDVLKGVGGALAGGAGVYAATGAGSAQSTGDESEGNLGTPARLQDVWVDQLLDGNDNQFLNVDPGEPINAQFGREWLFDSVSTGDLISTPGPTTSGLQTLGFEIADDDAVSFNRTTTGRTVGLIVVGSRTRTIGQGVFNAGFGAVSTIAQDGINNAGNVALSGTDGPDGTTSIGVDSGLFYIENRTGSMERYTILVLGR